MRFRTIFRSRFYRIARTLLGIAIFWTVLETYFIRRACVTQLLPPSVIRTREKIFIASIHWNNEAILRSHWSQAVLDLAHDLGTQNVFVSIRESGSWDDSKGALRDLEAQLEDAGVRRKVVLENTTHSEIINGPPGNEGWIETPRGKTELRRIPFLAKLRNEVLKPLYDMAQDGMVFDKILFLNDVVFTISDVRRLLATKNGEFAAACSLDFSKPPSFYDTFALRDSEGHAALTQTWPYFRGRESRRAVKLARPVPVKSCWNGMVAMNALPFYKKFDAQTQGMSKLQFRGVPDGLATHHLEGSECCLIHADNKRSASDGVWLNPAVRVGYNGPAYERVNPQDGLIWLSFLDVVVGSWENRLLRWVTTDWFTESAVARRLRSWTAAGSANKEDGWFCLINEMQVLVENGWAHV